MPTPLRLVTGLAGLAICALSGLCHAQDASVLLPAAPATCGAAGDLDGDGDIDLVIGQEARPLTLLHNDGRGAFTIAADAFSTNEGNVTALTLFDADGDKDLDVLVGGVEVLTRLWLNDGKAHFVEGSARLPETKAWVSDFGAGDLDGDGDLDLVVANRAGVSSVFRNDGVRFTVLADALPKDLVGATSLALADLDGDKDLDVVFGQRPDPSGKGGRNRAVRNDGKCTFSDATQAWMPSATDCTMGVALADVDGNGTLDLLCANRGNKPKEGARNAVHRRGDDGKFLTSAPSRYQGEAALANAVAAGDVDGDGDVDLVFGNEGFDAIYRNDGKGAFSLGEELRRWADDTRRVLLCDLDGDRDLDVVTINFDAPARCYLNSGTGQFGATAMTKTEPAPAPNPGDGGGAPAPKVTAVAAGKYASRKQGRATVNEAAPRAAINNALRFFAENQGADGVFRAVRFVGGAYGDAPVASSHDVGVTALVVLCFLAEGSHPSDGFYGEQVRDGVEWLMRQQETSGWMGPGDSHHGIYDHALATLVLAECFALSGEAAFREPLVRALAELERRRNPDGGFRYVANTSPSDTSATIWCALAQSAGQDAGIEMAPGAAARTLAFLRAMTDGDTGRTGYTDKGGLSARTKGEHEVRFPADKTEVLTGAALFTRMVLGDDPAAHDDMRKGWELLVAAPPKVDADHYFDPYGWCHIAHAMSQLGDPEWSTWRKALHEVLVRTQRSSGNLVGSWDPKDPWGYEGGRFATTALATLALQAEYRYARLVNPRWRRQ
jgi:hypothetical protein